MTELRINLKVFKEACIAVREEMARMVDGGVWTFEEIAADSFGGKRDWYRDDYEFSRTNFSTTPLWMQVSEPAIKTADDLRAALNVASMAAQQYGATQAQINYIVSLAVAQNDFNILSGGRLTKAEASRIIDTMKGK